MAPPDSLVEFFAIYFQLLTCSKISGLVSLPMSQKREFGDHELSLVLEEFPVEVTVEHDSHLHESHVWYLFLP